MAHTYTNNYQHIIFAVKYRESILSPQYNDKLQRYITGIVQAQKSYMIAINNVEDHIHLLVDLHRTLSISKFLQYIKAVSSKFINEQKWYSQRFEWQKGYGAFSVSYSKRDSVIEYIKNQQEHHQTHSFLDEYERILNLFDTPINEKNMFQPLISTSSKIR